jgi:hypothetical protein
MSLLPAMKPLAIRKMQPLSLLIMNARLWLTTLAVLMLGVMPAAAAPVQVTSQYSSEDEVDSALIQVPADVYAENITDTGDLIQPTTEESVLASRYKAKIKGYTFVPDAGDPINEDWNEGSEPPSISLAGTGALEWHWKVQYKLFNETAPGNIDGARIDLGAATWHDEGAIVGVKANGFIENDGERLRLIRYQVTNDSTVVAAGDNYWSLPGPEENAKTELINEGLINGNGSGGAESFSIEMWFRKGADPLFQGIYILQKDGDRNLGVRIGQSGGYFEVRIASASGGDRIANEPFDNVGDPDPGADAPSDTFLLRPVTQLDEEWHKWTIAYDGEGTYRLLRDGITVSQKITGLGDGVETVDPDPLEGYDPATGSFNTEVHSFGAASLNNLRIFNGAPAELVKEWTMDTAADTPADTPVGSVETDFNPVIAQEVTVEFSFGETPAVVDTLEVVMNDWRRVTWTYQGEVAYTFDAATGSVQGGLSQLNSQPFVRIYNEDRTPQAPLFGAGPNIKVWVPIGRKVDVGAYYRTTDRCFTMGEILGNPAGDLPDNLKIANLVDINIEGRLARVHTVEAAANASEIHWYFAPTIFRAEIPLGEAFDPENPNAVLVPALCDGAILEAGRDKPFGPALEVAKNSKVSGNGTQDTLRWDGVGEALYPVAPGSYQVDWPDANLPGESYKIEIVTGLPGDHVELASTRQSSSGQRETIKESEKAGLPGFAYSPYQVYTIGANDRYELTHKTDDAGNLLYFLKSTTLQGVDSVYPGAPGSHYRHLCAPAPAGPDDDDRRPPTLLDPSAADPWFFREMTFSESSVDNFGAIPSIDNNTNTFTAVGPGRSVLLYQYRVNPDEVATGDANQERLAVRVVESFEIADRKIVNDTDLSLGNKARALDQAFTVPGPIEVGGDRGSTNFSIDFWLNASALEAEDTAVSILEAGPGGDSLKVTLNPATRILEVNYLDPGAPGEPLLMHELPRTGAEWHHCVLQVYQGLYFDIIPFGVIQLYVDGVPVVAGIPIGSHPSATPTQLSSLTLGPVDGLLIDQFRVFRYDSDEPLSPDELDYLRDGPATMPAGFAFRPDAGGAGLVPLHLSNFETETAALGRFVNLQEVATRVRSILDRSGFGSGYILNTVSNYNADIYNRGVEVVGTWGPIFPVNKTAFLYDESNEGIQRLPDAKKLQVAYYENPYRRDTNEFLHPNVDWPYIAAEYNNVTYPVNGPHRDKAIYVASRIGSEGVDRNGYAQQIFDLAEYSDLTIYNQDNTSEPGYNPNEEHALVAASGRAALKVKNAGADIPNNPPPAAFALQNQVNITNSNTTYTSHPWVLVEVNNLETGEPEMAAYEVFRTRRQPGTTGYETGSNQSTGAFIPFPRPDDSLIADPLDGLAYEPAAKPEDRFLTLEAGKPYNFEYKFDFPVFAGDLLVPPYPLNLVVGNLTMEDDIGGNIQVSGVNQRTLWRDAGGHAWIVSGGGGKFFHQYYYPYRSDFYLKTNAGATPAIGTPVAWLPAGAGAGFISDDVRNFVAPTSVNVVYTSQWRTDYPKLKRGETLTYQGGEYFNENPGSKGLPALVAMAAAEIVYDSATPDMVIANSTKVELDKASARIIRPLTRQEIPFRVAEMAEAGFSPGSADISVIAERWYFRKLAGSLSKRFYFDSLAEKLVFRGYLNEKDSGNPDLTAGPDPLNVLEPGVMTLADYTKSSDPENEGYGLLNLSDEDVWKTAIDRLFRKSQDPWSWTEATQDTVGSLTNPVFRQGVKPVFAGLTDAEEAKVRAKLEEQRGFYRESDLSTPITTTAVSDTDIVQLDSFGVGAALVPNANLLTQAPTGSKYITIAENNRPELAEAGAPVSLHIVEIIPDRYRGAIKVVESADPFSEKVDLLHNGEFGANTGNLFYEWWVRDATQLNSSLNNEILSLTDPIPDPNWQRYAAGPGLHSITFQGRPDVVLSDKLVLMRYRHQSETAAWKLVPFTVANAVAAWQPGSSSLPAPFQWAGAANSPQLQADGSKRYIPQLVMGWIKRILDRINPYEARYTDFFSNESPATYSSQIQIAGGPYAGQVALNPDKNVIENVGLIELYETVLNRAKSLSIDNSSNGNATDGINQALLLATTRLSVLYELLAREAYSDAQDPTINAGANGSLTGVASYTHAFQNMEADLMHEELALLRGTDFRKSYPVYNRMFWNYAKGLGEAAYNVNYNIYDENANGFINEDDARALYPQGHGDAWGHYLSAVDMPYTLLQHPGFSWLTRSELYSLMQNVLEVDFLDEKTFTRLAAGRARTGRDIVRGAYRLAYTQDPDGQWQGYTDGANPARAWGVSEWAHRSGQAAYFDWAVANALMPEHADPDPDTPDIDDPENLDRIERLAAEDQISEIAGGLHEIQTALDEANRGVNPLGFDSDALTFDLDPKLLDGGAGGRKAQFEQVYERALVASGNALATLDYATKAENKLRALGDDTDAKIAEAYSQDLNYRNRLIEIFGRPYEGQVGFGKAYPEGYEGPDLLLFAYLDRTTIDQIVPHGGMDSNGDRVAGSDIVGLDFLNIKGRVPGFTDLEGLFQSLVGPDTVGYDNSAELKAALQTYIKGNTYTDPTVTLTGMPIHRASEYAFQSGDDWGQRTSYGELQRILEKMLSEEMALKSALDDYAGFLGDFETLVLQLEHTLEFIKLKGDYQDAIVTLRVTLAAAKAIYESAVQILELGNSAAVTATNITLGALPDNFVAGLAAGGDLTFAGVATTETIKGAVEVVSLGAKAGFDTAFRIADLAVAESIAALEREQGRLDTSNEILGLLAGIEQHTGDNGPKLAGIGQHLQNLAVLRQGYITAQGKGFSLLKERESFNTGLAAAVQRNRYNDMIFRLTRNEAMAKYQSAYQHAARYAWLAARAYDYETSLDPGNSAAPGQLLDRIVKERQLGLWSGGKPQVGQGGLAEILAELNSNYQVLKGQIGINNPQSGVEKISLRKELFRIGPGLADGGSAASDDRWADALKARIEPNLSSIPEFVRYCRPFNAPEGVAQPGIVIPFSSHIGYGVNFFGKQLMAGDHAYSSANFATKIRGFGVWLDDYNEAGLATTPRAYLVPVGADMLRTSSSVLPVTRIFNVVEQRVPTPFTINQANLTSPGYIPTLDGVEGSFAQLRRHGDFRMYHSNGDSDINQSELILDSRLVGRSVWNSRWLLIIPGANLHADPLTGVTNFAEGVTDIKIHFQTYSHQGQ